MNLAPETGSPFNRWAYFEGLASILNIVGRYEDAIEALEKALGLDPPLFVKRFSDIESDKAYALLGHEEEF